jgi:hypothetical protein
MTKIYLKTKSFFIFLIASSLALSSKAAIFPFSATYSGANEVPPNASTATGTIIGTYNDVTNTIYYTISFSGLSSNTTVAHFHGPAALGVLANPPFLDHTGFPIGVASSTYTRSHVFSDAQETWLKSGLVYSNIHTSNFPGGEIRAQIILGSASTTILSFNRTYSGANEVPPNNSTATGTISGTYDPGTNRIFFAISFSGLTAPASAAHFHGDTIPGANTKVVIGYTGFPNATSGSYFGTSVLTDAQEPGLLGGLWYSNIHNQPFPGGELRTQIFFNEIAEPTLTCPPVITVNNAPGLCSQTVTFAATATGSPTPALFYRTSAGKITSPSVFPVATTTVFVTAINGGGFKTCSFNVVVIDNEPPVIHNLAATPNKLWSPNHKMNDVAVNYTTTDNCGVPITCSLTVTSNEVANGKGDGNTGSDWVVVDNHNVKLRAERSGKGSGRVYTITTTCTDKNGVSSQKTTTVTVPHDARSARMGTDATQVANNKGLKLGIINNPSTNHFVLNIQTDNNQEKITVRVFDLHGRMVESKANLQGSQLLKIGSDLKPGFYIVELRQGKQVQKSKLVKAK